MPETNSSLLHGHLTDAVPTSTAILPPASSSSPSAKKESTPLVAPWLPPVLNLSESLTHFATDVKARLNDYQPNQSLRFKLHAATDNDPKVRIRRHARHLTVSVDHRLLSPALARPAEYQALVNHTAYRAMQRCLFTSLPFSNRGLTYPPFLFGVLSLLSVYIFAVNNPQNCSPIAVASLSISIAAAAAVCVFGVKMAEDFVYRQERRTYQHLLRRYGETGTRELLTATGHHYRLNSYLQQQKDAKAKHVARQQAKATRRQVKAVEEVRL